MAIVGGSGAGSRGRVGRRGACAAGAASVALARPQSAPRRHTVHTHIRVVLCRSPRGSSTTSLLDLCLSEWRFASYRAALESFRYFLILSGKDVVRAPRSTMRFRRWISRPAPDRLRCQRVWPSLGPVPRPGACGAARYVRWRWCGGYVTCMNRSLAFVMRLSTTFYRVQRPRFVGRRAHLLRSRYY